MSKMDSVIGKMADAIKSFEGWYPGSRSYRNNNPGNLRWFGSSIPWAGAIGTDESGHVIFDSEASGMDALKHQLRLMLTGQSSVYSLSDTLYEVFQKYAEGSQAEYAEFVAGKLNAPDGAYTTLQSLIL